ncbi:hypothetical protein SUDANB70_04016 [Streptomyces sp. enrichment culture]
MAADLLGRAAGLLGRAADLPADRRTTPEQLRFPPARMRRALTGVCRVAESGGRAGGYQIDSTHSGWSMNGLRLCWKESWMTSLRRFSKASGGSSWCQVLSTESLPM